MSFRKSLRARLILLIAALILSDVLLAQLARIFLWRDPTPERVYRTRSQLYHHDLVPMRNASVSWGGFHYRLKTNSLGFRDREVREVALRSSVYRILVIGDSFTEGVGFDSEDTFTGVLTEYMKTCHGIEVLNAGVISYSPSIYYKKVEHLIEEVGLEFNELIVFLDISDIQDEALFYEIAPSGNVELDASVAERWGVFLETASEDEETTLTRTKEFLKRNSVLLRFVDALKSRAGRIRSATPVVEDQKPTGPRLDFARSLWTVDQQYFEAFGELGLRKAALRVTNLHELLNRHNISLTLVVYPWPDQVNRGDRDSIQVRFWRDWAVERKIHFINLFPMFFDRPADEVLARYFITGDVHFSAMAHRRVGEELVRDFGSRLARQLARTERSGQR